MKLTNFKTLALIFSASAMLALSGCGSEGIPSSTGLSVTKSLAVTPPVAEAQDTVVNENTTDNAITLVGTDEDGDVLTYTIVTQPAHGTLGGSGANVTYTPAANYFGTDSFDFIVNDGTNDSSSATVSITVNQLNDINTSVLIGDGTTSISNTTRNVAVDDQGNIFVAYHSTTGIYVAKSIDNGHTFDTPILITNVNSEVEISTNGTQIFIAWVEVGQAMLSISSDIGETYGSPINAGLISSPQVHMAADGSNIYLLSQNSNFILYSNDNGLTFTQNTLAGGVYSDVHVDPVSQDVFAQTDTATLYYQESLDFGATFSNRITPGGAIMYSTAAISSGDNGRYLFVSGVDTDAFKIDLDTQTSTALVFGNNTAVQGRTLSADGLGNVVDGYQSGTSSAMAVSQDLGETFAAEIIVNADSQNLSVAIDSARKKVVAAYTKAGQVYVNTYDGLLKEN
ncbi:MAG: hypothetical protein GQ531_03345 [Sulfurovum sp.]|nr:hypothetical protein [Sulfurovum sp.]